MHLQNETIFNHIIGIKEREKKEEKTKITATNENQLFILNGMIKL